MGNEPQNFIPAFTDQEGPQPGPSWAKRGWLDTLADSAADLTAAMDPTEMKLAVAAIDALGFTAHMHAIGDFGVDLARRGLEHRTPGAARARSAFDEVAEAFHAR